VKVRGKAEEGEVPAFVATIALPERSEAPLVAQHCPCSDAGLLFAASVEIRAFLHIDLKSGGKAARDWFRGKWFASQLRAVLRRALGRGRFLRGGVWGSCLVTATGDPRPLHVSLANHSGGGSGQAEVARLRLGSATCTPWPWSWRPGSM